VAEKMKEIIGKCEPKGIAVGNFVETVEGAKKWIDIGVKYISYSVDTGIFYEACRDIVQEIRGK
jgi:4-hydroxy-2-oxoheptanedioate aldolase